MDLVWGAWALTKTFTNKTYEVSKKGTQKAWDTSKACGNKAIDMGKYCGGKVIDNSAGIGGGVVGATAGLKGAAGLTSLIGFKAGGVGAGTIAAGWNTYIGGKVVAGSLFSALQSYGATGVLVGPAILPVGILTAGTGLIGYKIINWWYKNDNPDPDVNVPLPPKPQGCCKCGAQNCSQVLSTMVKMDDLFLFKAER